MVRHPYLPEELGNEVVAPSGYYQPLEEVVVDYQGKQLLYVLGTGCIEASCCGKGSWSYARVEGFIAEEPAGGEPGLGPGPGQMLVDTIEDADEREAIAALLHERHPGVRVEFR